MGFVYLVYGHDYKGLGEYRESLRWYFKAKQTFEHYNASKNEPAVNAYTGLCISEVYLRMNKPDSALLYTAPAYKLAVANSDGGYILLATRIFGDIYFAMGNDETAMEYYRKYIPDYARYKERNRDLGFVFASMAKIFQKRNRSDSAIFYAKKALDNAQIYNDQENLFVAGMLLHGYFKGKNDQAALGYLEIATQAKDSMLSAEKLRQAQIFSFNQEVRDKERAAADARRNTRNRIIIIASAILAAIVTFLLWHRLRQLRLKYKVILERKESEKLKARYEKELLELEAKALRAQMNPHFVFNSLNSIKSLINKNENEHAAVYLTTFSKLIRILFQNSDKREITLYDELETCRLYTEIEKMRFYDKVDFKFDIDNRIDLKDLKVPALILQPFIENAIWHGLVPKETGGTVLVAVGANSGTIECIIEDDGIGRALSVQSSQFETNHQSKGIGLTRSRLELDKLLNNREEVIQIIDKVDAAGHPAGTRVILSFEKDKIS